MKKINIGDVVVIKTKAHYGELGIIESINVIAEDVLDHRIVWCGVETYNSHIYHKVKRKDIVYITFYAKDLEVIDHLEVQ